MVGSMDSTTKNFKVAAMNVQASRIFFVRHDRRTNTARKEISTAMKGLDEMIGSMIMRSPPEWLPG